jgi:hypothetical protein
MVCLLGFNSFWFKVSIFFIGEKVFSLKTAVISKYCYLVRIIRFSDIIFRKLIRA